MLMEWLQSLLDSSSTPVLTAFLLGLLTSISPCPLATNIAAIGFIGKHIESRRRIFVNGLLYTLGRVVAYTVLGVVLLVVLKGGSGLFGIQKFVGKYGEMLLGPALLLVFRHADSHVGNCDGRLAVADRIRYCYRVTRAGRSVDIGIQRWTNRSILRKNANRAKVAQLDRRRTVRHNRNLLLHRFLFLKMFVIRRNTNN